MGTQFSEDIWEIISSLWKQKNIPDVENLSYNDLEVRLLVNIFFISWRALKSATEPDYDVKRAWRKVDARTARQRKIVFPLLKYVAILAIAVCVAIISDRYVYIHNMPITILGTDSIMPGVQKAELILANGQRLVLDAHKGNQELEALGVELINDSGEGQLYYKVSSKNKIDTTAYNTLRVPKGGEYSLILPDGTRVWVNSETSLRFPVHFSANKREIYLEGEAFFRVARDTNSPFYVHVDGGKIAVLGTSFNVSAYKSDGIWQTTLVNGTVKILERQNNMIMKPGEQYTVDGQTGAGKLRMVDTELYTSWVDGKFYFKAYAFEEIVKKLERWYDFTMIYQDESIKRMRFSGTINKHRSIDEMLCYLEKTTNIRFRISGKNIVVSRI